MASLVSARTIRITSRKNPTLLSRVRSSRDNGFPRTASAMRNISWPPSRIGMGSRFRMARLIEKNATKVRSQSRPRRATCPEIWPTVRSEEHTSELQSHSDLVCRLLLEKKNNIKNKENSTHTLSSYRSEQH